jgi:hypothetical protein
MTVIPLPNMTPSKRVDRELPDHFTCLNCLILCVGILLLVCRQVTQVWLHMWLARLIDPLVGRYTPMDFYTLDSSSYNIVALLHSNFQELVMRWFHRCDSILASMLVLEHFANLAPWINQISLDDLMCAQDVKWLQTITKLPILVKGVMTAEDSTKSQTLAISLSE